MAYSIISMRGTLESLQNQKLLKLNDKTGGLFVWEGDPGHVHEGLASQFNVARGRPNPLNDLTEYCWRVYDKAFHSAGRQIIGRTGDLWAGKTLLKFGLVSQTIVDEREQAKKAGLPPRKELQGNQLNTLWTDKTDGNVQVMDKWSPVVNDAWVLGGVHRLAEFELVSPQAPGNLWDVTAGYHVVTARELLGLRQFGYQGIRQATGHVLFRCTNPNTAQTATLEAYTTLMARAQNLGANSVTGLIQEIMPGLNEEIRSFDRKKLRHVAALS